MTEILYRGAGKAQDVQRDIEHKASSFASGSLISLGCEMARRLRALDNMVEFYRAEFGKQSAGDKLIPLEQARRILDGKEAK